MHAKIQRCLLFVFALAFTMKGYTQTDRDYIISRLRLFYIPTPNTTTTIIPIPVSRVLDTTVANIFGTSSNNNMDQFAEFLKQLFRPVGKGGQPFLQKYTASILRLNNKIVYMQIYNDFNTGLNATAVSNFNPCLGSSNEVWPCAWNLVNATDAATVKQRDTMIGYISMGEQYFRNNGITIGRRTYLHELMHTQDHSDRREHLWSVQSTGQSYSYGADNVHYFTELVPNLSATYKEGIANSFTYIYSTAEETSVKNWFAENGEFVVETTPGGGAVATADCFYNAIKSTNPPGAGRNPDAARFNNSIVSNYKLYRIAELPSKYIIHNEQIIGIIASKYAAKVGFDKFMAALRQTNADVTWVSTSAVAQLIKNMCIQALPAGKSISDVANSSQAQMPYLLPMALADYFTYYRSTSEADFKAIFENLLPDAWVDLYWTGGKDFVRSAAKFNMSGGKPSGTQKVEEHLTAIATILGIK